MGGTGNINKNKCSQVVIGVDPNFYVVFILCAVD